MPDAMILSLSLSRQYVALFLLLYILYKRPMSTTSKLSLIEIHSFDTHHCFTWRAVPQSFINESREDINWLTGRKKNSFSPMHLVAVWSELYMLWFYFYNVSLVRWCYVECTFVEWLFVEWRLCRNSSSNDVYVERRLRRIVMTLSA